LSATKNHQNWGRTTIVEICTQTTIFDKATEPIGPLNIGQARTPDEVLAKKFSTLFMEQGRYCPKNSFKLFKPIFCFTGTKSA